MANLESEPVLSPVPEFSSAGLEAGDLEKQLPEFDERDYSSTLPTSLLLAPYARLYVHNISMAAYLISSNRVNMWTLLFIGTGR